MKIFLKVHAPHLVQPFDPFELVCLANAVDHASVDPGIGGSG